MEWIPRTFNGNNHGVIIHTSNSKILKRKMKSQRKKILKRKVKKDNKT